MAAGGGPLYDIGIYCLNAARYCFAEDPIEVWASATRSADPRFREVDETLSATLRFKDEKVATFTCSFGAADRSTYTIVGTKGTLTMDPAYEYAEGLAYETNAGGRTRRRKLARSDQFAPELLYSRIAFSTIVILNPRERRVSSTCASSKECCVQQPAAVR